VTVNGIRRRLVLSGQNQSVAVMYHSVFSRIFNMEVSVEPPGGRVKI